MIQFKILDERYSPEALGLIPAFLTEASPLSARSQFDHNYRHGGGWQPMARWSLGPVGEIMYPGEPALHPIAVAQLGSETIYIYPHAWVSIVQEDGSFEVSRMD